jgi:hypothetical protein
MIRSGCGPTSARPSVVMDVRGRSLRIMKQSSRHQRAEISSKAR